MSEPEKICPQCRTRSALSAQFCASCGRQFRTQFVPPDDRTMMAPPAPVYYPPPSPAPVSEGPSFLANLLKMVAVMVVVAILGGCGILVFGGIASRMNQNSEQQTVRALRLQQVRMGMTRAQVQELGGPPDNTQSMQNTYGREEYWYYKTGSGRPLQIVFNSFGTVDRINFW